MKDHYTTLGLRKPAKPGEIKIAYQKLAAKYHPDRSSDPGSAEQFVAVKLAYEALRDGASRMAYDNVMRKTILDDPEQSARQIWDTYLMFSKARAVCDNGSFLDGSKLGMSVNEKTLTVHDTRSYFERTLSYGVQRGILNQQKLEVISAEATDAILQIAQYFSTPYRWTELELANDRLVNLISLHLESCAQANLHHAAEMILNLDLYSHSRAGAEKVRRMLELPHSTNFGMFDHDQEFNTEDFAKWSLQPLAEVEEEYSMRMQTAQIMSAAVYFAKKFGVGETRLQNAFADAEAVIRSSLLTLAYGGSRMPDLAMLCEILVDLGWRAKSSSGLCFTLPNDMPESLHSVAKTLSNTLLADLAKLAKSKSPKRMLQQSPSFVGRYFWVE